MKDVLEHKKNKVNFVKPGNLVNLVPLLPSF